ncbi:hypothetical protein CLAIMM_02732, partial [Cladophialophora immunda]
MRGIVPELSRLEKIQQSVHRMLVQMEVGETEKKKNSDCQSNLEAHRQQIRNQADGAEPNTRIDNAPWRADFSSHSSASSLGTRTNVIVDAPGLSPPLVNAMSRKR